jgi:transposase InsO family protein
MSRLVSTKARKLSKAEIQQAFAEDAGTQFPPILNVAQLAELAQISPKTIYEWIAKGRLNGAFRKRGKHHLIWRDRAIDILFKGSRHFEAQYPGELWQMDVTYVYIRKIRVLYLVVIIDDHSRFCVGAELCRDQRADTLIGALMVHGERTPAKLL